MKRTIFSHLILLAFSMAHAQNFEHVFCDSTLRIDYIFSGNSAQQTIAIDKLNIMPGWYGKRRNLTMLPTEGNGQISVRDHHFGVLLYRNSFSTLFQEWLSYEESSIHTQAFENVFLLPMPKDTIDVTIDLRNNRRSVIASQTTTIAPSDILIRQIGFRQTTPYETIQQARDPLKSIYIAFLAEGYTENEMDVFLEDAKKATEALFAHEPFTSMRDYFHITAVMAPSKESGTSEPSKGIWKETALHSHFDTFYSTRYLTTLRLKDLHDWLAGIPYEHIIVLVNTAQYGGGGIFNSYNLSMTHHPQFKSVVVHEFGHSFAGLGDEYAYETEQIPMYPQDIEPWEANLTTLVDFHDKWENLIKEGTPIPTPSGRDKRLIGIYRGAGYDTQNVYRGCLDCRMRTNEYPEFCPVCQQAILRLIRSYIEETATE